MAGNSNSGSHKDKLFRKALVMEIKIRDAGEDMKTLRQIASGVIDDALNTNPEKAFQRKDAVNMIADRIDGKPAQAIIGGEDDDPAIKLHHKIERLIVDPANPNS